MSKDIIINELLVELKDYDIKNIIGAGGFGVVFKAIEKKTSKEVALKVISQTETLKKQKEQANILREISVPRLLHLPGIVQLLGFRFPLTSTEIAQETSKGTKLKLEANVKGKRMIIDFSSAIIITELMKNGSLDIPTIEYLRTKKVTDKMNPTIRSKAIFGVAATMKRVHQNNVVHRDLKLENVFLDENMEPRIADFGLAKVVQNEVSMTMAIGTPYIMAPEIFMDGDETYGVEVDVYAFAFLIYKMFTNTIAFADGKPFKSPQQFMMKIGKRMRPKRPDSIPDAYWELVQKCWRHQPEERPTFEEIVEELKDDKYAINELGEKTDLDKLHEYQKRIDVDVDTSGKWKKVIPPRILNRKTHFIWTRK